MMKRSLLPAFLLFCLLALATNLSAFAADGNASVGSDDLGITYYLDSDDIDLVHILAPPPAPGSKAQDADMSAVLDAQRARTPSDIEDARGDNKLDVFRFADVLGGGFSHDKLPTTAALFRHVTDDAMRPIEKAKSFFNRPRPFVSYPDLEPLVTKPTNASYPSGHATFAYLSAILLSMMVPEKSADIFARADRFAHNRVVDGVHYPTDIEAGRISAAVIAQALLHDPRFRIDFAQARAELRNGIGLK